MNRRVKPGNLQLVSFVVNENLYGLDIRLMKEVNQNTRITPVPLSPAFIRGLVNIRGQVVLVSDISVIFGQDRLGIGESSQIVIIKTMSELQNTPMLDERYEVNKFPDKQVGFLVDAIGDVITVPVNKVAPRPSHLTGPNTHLVEGVFQHEGGPLVLLNGMELVNVRAASNEDNINNLSI